MFTEDRDTLNYLVDRIRALVGQPEAVAAIHGGIARSERRAVQMRFSQDPECVVLVATDAAGEGLNYLPRTPATQPGERGRPDATEPDTAGVHRDDLARHYSPAMLARLGKLRDFCATATNGFGAG